MNQKISLFIKNYLALLIFVWLFYLIYVTNRYYDKTLSDDTKTLLLYVSLIYSTISVPIIIYKINNGLERKALKALLSLFILIKSWSKNIFSHSATSFSSNLSKQEQSDLRFLLVKFFFIPLMLNFTVNNFTSLKHQVLNFNLLEKHISITTFNSAIFPLIFSFLFLIDTLYFSFGYLFEFKWLKNKVKSVEPTIFGWAVALVCYPPFCNHITDYVQWYASDSAYFFNAEITFIAKMVLIALLIIYVSASVTLGTKCSNLTNRGIVSSGVYSVVRHPAYIAKNLIWWITIIPVIHNSPFAIASMAFWSLIYFMRAVTEERHLMQDPDYQAYCEKVKYRFVPYIY